MDSELSSGLTAEESGRLHALASTRRFAAGTNVFALGEEANVLYVIRSGRIELTFPLHIGADTRDVRSHTLEAGQAVAWSALVPPHRLTTTARAPVEAELLCFPRATLLKFLDEEPRIGFVVMRNLARVIGARLLAAQALWVREVQRQVTQDYGLAKHA